MGHDVFHQVLLKISEAAGGNPRQMVNIVELVKRERLNSHLEGIVAKLQGEGWIADATRQDHVYLTTWGMEEVKRVTPTAAVLPAYVAPVAPAEPSRPPAPAVEVSRADAKNAEEIRKAAERVRELAAVLDELTAAGGTPAQRRAKAKKALAAATTAVEKAFA